MESSIDDVDSTEREFLLSPSSVCELGLAATASAGQPENMMF